MTGYGSAERDFPGIKIGVEIKSLNHRYLDFFIRAPREINCLEIDIRNYLKRFIKRGRIDLLITLERDYSKTQLIDVDIDLAKQYYFCLRKLREDLGLNDRINLQDISRYSDILQTKEKVSNEELWPMLQGVLDLALSRLKEMREREGLQISNDIIQRIDIISSHLEVIAERIPTAINEYKSFLNERINEVFHLDINSEKLEQEMILHAERTDVTEEKVRIDIHINGLRDLFNEEESMGRKMDFLVQEILREVNTLGAKALDSVITERVVEIKHELEKIKEQIQNIE